MSARVDPSAHINLKDATILVAEPNPLGMDILGQILAGFGARRLLRAEGYEEAQAHLMSSAVDLIICEGILRETGSGPDGYDLIHWLRRSGLDPNAYAPALVISAHTSQTNVTRARDCGANFFVVKPLAPAVMLERIVWMARSRRPHVTCDAYVGPDRRFKNHGPPQGCDGRRSTDLTGDLGAALEPNMSQDQINSLIQPTRVSL